MRRSRIELIGAILYCFKKDDKASSYQIMNTIKTSYKLYRDYISYLIKNSFIDSEHHITYQGKHILKKIEELVAELK